MNVNILKGILKHNINRDSYWARMVLQSEDNKQTFLYVCVSHEYLGDTFKNTKFDDKLIENWFHEIAEEWAAKGEVIFKKPFHLEVRAITEEGYSNGMEFLKKEIVPISH